MGTAEDIGGREDGRPGDARPGEGQAGGGPAGEVGPAVAGTGPGRGVARRFWRLLPVAVLAAGLLAFILLAPDDQAVFQLLKEHRAALTGWTGQNPVLAVLAFILLYTLVAAFSLPISAVITLLGGFLFGAVLGSAAVTVGATAGAVLLFLAVRAAFADTFRARFGRRIARMERGFAENAFSYMLFLRLVPVFPFFLVNIAPAFFGVGLGTFALATFIGIIPATFVYANVGASLGRLLDGADRLTLDRLVTLDAILALSLLALLSLAPLAYRKLRARFRPVAAADRSAAGERDGGR